LNYNGFADVHSNNFNEFFKSIVEITDIGISVVDKNGIFVYVNQSYCNLYDLEINQLKGKSISEVIPFDKVQSSYDQLNEILTTGVSVDGETRFCKKDGSEIYLKVVKKRIQASDGDFYRLTTITDITEFKRNEVIQSVLLEISHQSGLSQNTFEIYNNICETLNEIIPADSFYIGLINEATCKFSYIEKNHSGELFSQYDNLQFESLLKFVLNTGMSLLVNKEKIIKLSALGKIDNINSVPEVWIGVPLYIKEKIIGIIALFSFSEKNDFSEQTKEILEFVAEQIAHVIERRRIQDELIKAKNKAEESDRLKSEFLTQISHEIRTPINSILSFSELLKNDLKPHVTDELNDSFLMIERGGKRLIRTIDMILNMSQIHNYEKYLEFKKCNLQHDILIPIIAQFQNLAQIKGIKLDFYSEIENSDILCDYYSVNQIFLNLIENAIKFTDYGGVACKLYSLNLNKLVVEIEDTGIGISEEYIPKLFSVFLQEERGYTRKYDGNGLGLALVKKFADLNEAEIEVKSQKGKGTTFFVIFKNCLVPQYSSKN